MPKIPNRIKISLQYFFVIESRSIIFPSHSPHFRLKANHSNISIKIMKRRIFLGDSLSVSNISTYGTKFEVCENEEQKAGSNQLSIINKIFTLHIYSCLGHMCCIDVYAVLHGVLLMMRGRCCSSFKDNNFLEKLHT